ncbi:MAG: hypothetical protein IKC63_01605 [Clostridia bacterium]|nr:hypothetical protein [Clostridia bacterium]
MAWWNHLKKDNSQKLEKLKEDIENEGGVSRKDTFAMVASALLIILPVALLVLLGLAAIILIPLLLMG